MLVKFDSRNEHSHHNAGCQQGKIPRNVHLSPTLEMVSYMNRILKMLHVTLHASSVRNAGSAAHDPETKIPQHSIPSLQNAIDYT